MCSLILLAEIRLGPTWGPTTHHHHHRPAALLLLLLQAVARVIPYRHHCTGTVGL